jgi:hypothetical protein
MHLHGSCHCGAVKFSVEAYAPVPYLRCYCSICRKTAGASGYAINIGAKFATLNVEGGEHITVFRAVTEGEPSSMERRFCAKCGSALWGWSPEWPDLVHPFASAIDTPLAAAPKHHHMMLGSKPDWVPLDTNEGDELFDKYPDRSLEEWHRERDLLDDL